MIIQYIIVGIGGSFGATLRFIIETWVNEFTKTSVFPFGTLVVNLLGCLLIGFLFGIIAVSQLIGSRARLLLITGFLGALTTFSSFGYETFVLIRNQDFFVALVNILIQVLAGLFAVWSGYVISRILAKFISR
jgi:fluoride exporter